MQSKCPGKAGTSVVGFSFSVWLFLPATLSACLPSAGPCPQFPGLAQRRREGPLSWPGLSAGLSLTFAALATASQQARPKTTGSQRPMVCGPPSGPEGIYGAGASPELPEEGPSPPPPSVTLSSWLAELQVVHLGSGDS